MRILITGSNGMLGSDLVEAFSEKYEIFGLGKHPNRHPKLQYHQADLAHSAQIKKAVSEIKPAVIVHAAAYTDVDGCELNPHQAFLINTIGTQSIAEASDQTGATLIFLSSDYVFNGKKSGPYLETDSPDPISVYGRSKFEAEEWLKNHSKSVSIIRTSWLFGKNGRNFFRAILNLLSEGKDLNVVNDQLGAPTYTLDLAEGIKMFIERAKRPKGHVTYHLANTGSTTWHGAALKLIELTKEKKQVKAITTDQLNRPAKRPANSVLNLEQIKNTYQISLRSWEDALNHYWKQALSEEWQRKIRKQHA